MKPLDIIRTPGGGLAVVTEVCSDGSASIEFLHGCNPADEKNAWWGDRDLLVVLDSIPRLLANAMAHPFGTNTKQGNRFFPIHGEPK